VVRAAASDHEAQQLVPRSATNPVERSPQNQDAFVWLVAGSGVAVFISGFLPWAHFGLGSRGVSVAGTQTEWSGTVMILLGVAVTICGVIVGIGNASRVWLRVTAGLGVAATGLAIYKIADTPNGASGLANPSVGFGLWIALLAGALAAAFSVAALSKNRLGERQGARLGGAP
jgi:hypothetical protein